jgi:hypothetical protein
VEVDSILSDVVYLEERNNRSFENRERTVGGVKSFLSSIPYTNGRLFWIVFIFHDFLYFYSKIGLVFLLYASCVLMLRFLINCNYLLKQKNKISNQYLNTHNTMFLSNQTQIS